jgi:hypothetical protein
LAERKHTQCIIEQSAAEAGITCHISGCPRLIDASECRLLKINNLFPSPAPVSTKPEETSLTQSLTILDLLEKAIPDNVNVKKKPVEVETIQEFMGLVPDLNQNQI